MDMRRRSTRPGLKKTGAAVRTHLLMKSPSQTALITMLALLLAGVFFVSLWAGPIDLDPMQIFFNKEATTPHALIFWEIRLPRSLLALLAGSTLGLSGAVMQGYLRNPLASPGLLGNASGAALFSVILLYFGIHSAFWLPIAGMLGSFTALMLVLLMAGRNASMTVLILSGVAINSVCAAAMALLLNLAPSPWAVRDLYLWLQGSLSNVSSTDLKVMILPLVIGWMLLLRHARSLDALTFGEDTAISMGVDTERVRIAIVIGLSLAIGAVVPVTGIIGFIGLVVPHILRPVTGYLPSRLLIPSALTGAILLLIADLFVRAFSSGQELRIGVLTSIIGGPFFVALIIKHRKTLF